MLIEKCVFRKDGTKTATDTLRDLVTVPTEWCFLRTDVLKEWCFLRTDVLTKLSVVRKDGTEAPTETSKDLRDTGARWGQHVLEGVHRCVDLPLLFITSPYMAHCMGACTPKGS